MITSVYTRSYVGSSHFLFELATTQFCCFPLALMACVDGGSNTSTSHFFEICSPTDSGPDLDGMDHRSYDAQFKDLRDMLVPLVRNVANFESHIQTTTNSVVLLKSRITDMK